MQKSHANRSNLFKVLHITAPVVLPNQGDVDYANTLNNALKKQGVNSTYPVFADRKSSSVMDDIRRERIIGIPLVAHVHLRPPNGGTLLNPDHLKAFDKLVVTVHEFIHLKGEQAQALEYIKAADHVIFSTPYELSEVEKSIPDIRKKSSVIPIFPTVPVMERDEVGGNRARPLNIVHFSSIRAGKGHADFVRLGALIQQDQDLQKYQETHGPIKMYMVGNPISPRLLMQLIGVIYNIPKAELPKIRYNRGQDDIIEQFLQKLKDENISPQFPIEICLSVSPKQLQDICRNCNFAYLPIKRGATHHSTALPVLMSNGCVALTTMGGHTPEELKNGAVIFANTPEDALKSIKRHMQQPQKSTKVRKAALEYVDSISVDRAASAHADIYNGVVKHKKYETESVQR